MPLPAAHPERSSWSWVLKPLLAGEGGRRGFASLRPALVTGRASVWVQSVRAGTRTSEGRRKLACTALNEGLIPTKYFRVFLSKSSNRFGWTCSLILCRKHTRACLTARGFWVQIRAWGQVDVDYGFIVNITCSLFYSAIGGYIFFKTSISGFILKCCCFSNETTSF